MGRAIFGSAIAVLLVAIGCAAAVPVQAGANMLQRDEYGAPVAEILSRYIEEHGVANPRILDGIDGSHFLGQNRRGLNSLSGVTFDESKGYQPARRIGSPSGRPSYMGEIDRTAFDRFSKRNIDEIDRNAFDRFSKRNIDEIDRNAFDSFFKRNLDEIDRVGWSGFVKRFDDYLSSRQRL